MTLRNHAMRIMLFNKHLHTEYALENLYQLVKDGKWTLEVFNGMMKDIPKDLNGD